MGTIALIGFAIFLSALLDSNKTPNTDHTANGNNASTPGNSLPAPSLVRYWGESDNYSQMDGTHTIVISRKSNDSYDAWIGTHTPALIVQCYTKQHPDVFAEIGAPASVEYGMNSHTVRLRFDASQPIKQHWSASKDDKALFSPDPTELLQDLKKHQTMLFEFDPFNTSTTATVSFDLDGLRESLAKHPECRSK